MNTTFIAMAIAIFLSVGILFGIGALSLLTGAFHFLFVKPKLQFLKSQYAQDGFAFGFAWDQSIEEVRFDRIKIQLFNPFGSPTQLEITREFEASGVDFAVDLNLGAPLKDLVNAKGFDTATVEISVSSATGGVTHTFSMKGKTFKEKLSMVSESVDDFKRKHKIEKVKPIYISAPERSFIAGPLPKAGKVLKLATNPEFAAQFVSAGGDAEAGPTVTNFAVSKVWIEPGCIVCNACEGIFPEVFHVTDTCVVRPNAPFDNGLKIQEAAEACPVEVIKFTKI